MKVKTTGDFMLTDILGGQEIEAEGVTEVTKTEFVARALADGRLKEVGGKPVPKEEAKPVPKEEAKSDDSPPTSGKGATK